MQSYCLSQLRIFCILLYTSLYIIGLIGYWNCTNLLCTAKYYDFTVANK